MGAHELDLLGRNAKGNAEPNLLGVARVEANRCEGEAFWKGMIAERVDVGVVHGEEEMPGFTVDHGNLWEFRNVIPGDDHVQLVVAVSTATRLRKSMRADTHVAPVWMRCAEGACEERLILYHRGHRLTSDRSVPIEENPSSVRAMSFPGRSAKDIVSSNPILVVKT